MLCAVPHHDDAVRPEDVVDHLKTVLASYKVPKRVLIVDEDDLTHTSSGEKLKTTDLKRLAARLIAAADEDRGAHLRAAHPAARTCQQAERGPVSLTDASCASGDAVVVGGADPRTMAIDYIAVIEDEAARILMPTGRTAARCRGPTAGA